MKIGSHARMIAEGETLFSESSTLASRGFLTADMLSSASSG